jgi:hypothetical protein
MDDLRERDAVHETDGAHETDQADNLEYHVDDAEPAAP